MCFHLAFGVRPAAPPSGRASLQGSPSPGILGFTPSKRTRDRSPTDSRQPITLFPPLPPYYAAQTTCPPRPPSSDQDRTRLPEPSRRYTVAPPPRRLKAATTRTTGLVAPNVPTNLLAHSPTPTPSIARSKVTNPKSLFPLLPKFLPNRCLEQKRKKRLAPRPSHPPGRLR